MEDDEQHRGDEENGQQVETLEREEEVNERRDNERSDTWWHVDQRSFMKTRRATPWAMRCKQGWSVRMCEKIRGVRVFCSQHTHTHSFSSLPPHRHTHAVLSHFMKPDERQSQRVPSPDCPMPVPLAVVSARQYTGTLGILLIRHCASLQRRRRMWRRWESQSYWRRLPRLVVSSSWHSEHHADITVCRCNVCVACGFVVCMWERDARRQGGREREQNMFQKKRNRNWENVFLNEKRESVNREFGEKMSETREIRKKKNKIRVNRKKVI